MGSRISARLLPENGARAVNIVVLIVILIALYYGKPMLAPLALAILLSLLLTPPVRFLERYIGRLAAVIVSVGLSIAILSSAGYGLGVKAADLKTQFPQYKERIRGKIEALKKSAGSVMGKSAELLSDLTKESEGKATIAPIFPGDGTVVAPNAQAVTPRINLFELIGSILGPLLAPLETALIVLIFSIYILIQPDDLRNRLLRLAGRNKIRATSHAFDEVSQKVSHFLLMQTIINIVYGVLIALGMTAMGFSDGILWGGLVALLRFVPYVGTWIAAIPPFLILLATTDGWQPAYLLALFVFMDMLFAFLIEPLVIGGGIGISPLSLLVAAIFWAWMWGALGLLLSTPLTVCLAVMGKHVGVLRFLNVLLTDKPVLNARVRFYHRLVSDNRSTALDLLRGELHTHSHTQMCDDMLLPALALSEIDLQGGRFPEERAKTIRALAVEIVGEASAEKSGIIPPPKFTPDDLALISPCAVLCVPAQTDADVIAGGSLAALLRTDGVPASELPAFESIQVVLKSIAEKRPEIVCISALRPGAAANARSLYRKIHARYPKVLVVVGIWTRRAHSRDLRQRFDCKAPDCLVSSFANGVETIESILAGMIETKRSEKPSPLVAKKE